MFIAIDGVDGAGKTTQAELLFKRLGIGKCILTREPTKTEMGAIIRDFLAGHKDLNLRTMQLLFVADRSEHADKVIEPKLKEGYTVITDRYLFSTIAYGIASGMDKEWLMSLNSKFPIPDITIILDIDPKIALKRVDGRKNGKEIFEKLEFQKKVHDAYIELKSHYKNYFIIDASKSEKEVSEQINKIVDKHYP